MKRAKKVCVAVILLCGVGIASAAPDPSAEIRALLDRQVAAWNRGDIDGFMDGYLRSDKIEFVSAGKITRGWQTVRDRYHRKYDTREKMGTLAFSEIKVRSLTANIAAVQGRWRLRRKGDQPHGSFVLIFKRTSAGWRIVHDETS